MQRKTVTWFFILLITALAAWSPWITPATASRMAETQFDEAWRGIIDGCGTYGNDLGAKSFRKVPFGAHVTLNYQCGLVAPNEPALQTTVYVSFVGIAFGYPSP